VKRLIPILALLGWLIALPSWAAVTITQHVGTWSNASANSVALTVTSTASGALLIVSCGTNYPLATDACTGVTDNQSNTYTEATNAASTGASSGTTDVYYKLSGTGGVTTVTCSYTLTDTKQKYCHLTEVAGFTTAAFDLAGHVDNQTASSNVETGASITTTSTTGFVLGVVMSGSTVDQNPNSGNEFTSGGDVINSDFAVATLISSTAAAHQPVWHANFSTTFFSASTVAFKEAAAAVTTTGWSFGGGWF